MLVVFHNVVANGPLNCWEEILENVWSGNLRNGTFEKITRTVAEVALIEVSSHKVASKQNKRLNKNKYTKYTMASPYHSKTKSTQNMGDPLPSCLGHGAYYYIYIFCKGKVFLKTLT